MSDPSIVLEKMVQNHCDSHDHAFYYGIRADLIHFIDTSKHYLLSDGEEFTVLPEARFLATYGCSGWDVECCKPFPRCIPNFQLQSHPMARVLTHRVRLSEKLANVFHEEQTTETTKKSRCDSSTKETLSPSVAYAITQRWREFVIDLGETAMLLRRPYGMCDFLIEDSKTVLEIPIRTDSAISRSLEEHAAEAKPPSNENRKNNLLFSISCFTSQSQMSWSVYGTEAPTSCVHTKGEEFEYPRAMAISARARWITELMPSIARELIARVFSISSFRKEIGCPISIRPLLRFNPMHFISPDSILIRKATNLIFFDEIDGSVPLFMPRLRADEPELRVQERALFSNLARVLAFLYTGEILSPTFEYTGTPSAMALRISRFGDTLMPEYYELICKLARGTSSNHYEIDQLANAAFAHHSRGLSMWKMRDLNPEESMSKIEFTDIESVVVGIAKATENWRHALLPPFDSWRGDATFVIKERVMKFRKDGESDEDTWKRIVGTNPNTIAAESELLAWNAYYSGGLKHREYPRDVPDLKLFGEIQLGLTPVRAFLLVVLWQYFQAESPEPLLEYDESNGIMELRRCVRLASVPVEDLDYHQSILHIIKFFLVSPATPPFICGPALLYATAGLPYDATAIAGATFLIDPNWYARIDWEPSDNPLEMKKTYAESAYEAHRVAFEAMSKGRWGFTNAIEQRIPRFRIPDFLSMMCTGISFSEFATLQHGDVSLEDFQSCLISAIAANGLMYKSAFDDFYRHLQTNYDQDHFSLEETTTKRELTLTDLFFDVMKEKNAVCNQTRSLYQKLELETVCAKNLGYLVRFILESEYDILQLLYKTLTDEGKLPAALVFKARSLEVRNWIETYTRVDVPVVAEKNERNFWQMIDRRILLQKLPDYAAGYPFDIQIQVVTPNNWKPEHVSIPSVLTCSRKLCLRENSSYDNFCTGMQKFLSEFNKFSML